MPNNAAKQVFQTVRETIKKYDMIKPDDRILVGVSGGADSVCLLHLLKSMSKEHGFSIGVAHVNHGIRDAEAEADADFVKQLCKGWEIPFYLHSASVPKFAAQENLSEETAGRLIRYRFFRDLCEKHRYTKIATAHNRNDQAETVLMRIMRGSGTSGLAGIRYVRKDGIIRPLLDLERREIEAYCNYHHLQYRNDKTNEDNDYTRNRIRNRMIPMMQEEFNPNIVAALSSLAQNAAEDGDFLNEYAKRLYRQMNYPLPKQKPVTLDIESLRLVGKSIRARMISLALLDAAGEEYRPEHKHLDAILELLDKPTGTEAQLPGNLSVRVEYDKLVFALPEDEKPVYLPDGKHFEIEPGKTYEIGDYRITAEVCDMPTEKAENQMRVDYDKLEEEKLTMRTRKTGDTIALYKDGKGKSLKDFMIDAKIPARKRGGIPLLCKGNEVIAVIGVRVAEPYKISNTTKRGLVIGYGTKDESR